MSPAEAKAYVAHFMATGNRLGFVERRLGVAIVVALVVTVPFVRWATEMVGGGFPDSGRVVGTMSLAVIACVLGLVFWPAAWAVLRDDPVPTECIGLFALALATAHVAAYVGVTASTSNAYFLAYPLASAIATSAILRFAGPKASE